MRSSFQSNYNLLSGGQESCDVVYRSSLIEGDFLTIAQENREKDIVMGRTTGGVHKDDLVFMMNDQRLKIFGSQGQLKSYILSLKLAQYIEIKQAKQVHPVLLMDDVFDKLDADRVTRLLRLLNKVVGGQIFITDKDVKTIPLILDPLSIDYRIFEIENGQVI